MVNNRIIKVIREVIKEQYGTVIKNSRYIFLVVEMRNK